MHCFQGLPVPELPVPPSVACRKFLEWCVSLAAVEPHTDVLLSWWRAEEEEDEEAEQLAGKIAGMAVSWSGGQSLHLPPC